MVSVSSYPTHHTQHQPTQYTQAERDYINKRRKLIKEAKELTQFFTIVNELWKEEKKRVFIVDKKTSIETSKNFDESTRSQDLTALLGKRLYKTYEVSIAIHDDLYSSVEIYLKNLIEVEATTLRTPPTSPSAASRVPATCSDSKTP